MTATERRRLGEVIKRVMNYRGYSPRTLAQRYLPEKPPLSVSAIYRLIAGEDEALTGEDGELKLLQMAGMLRLPPTALMLVYAGDTDGIKRLAFPGEDGEAVRQFVLDLMRPANPGAGKRRRAV